MKDESITKLVAKYCFEVLTAFDALSNWNKTPSLALMFNPNYDKIVVNYNIL